MDAVLHRKTEQIFKDVVDQYDQQEIDQANRWIAMALAAVSQKVPLKEAKVFLMRMVMDCPSILVEMAREIPVVDVTEIPVEKQ